MIYYYDDPIPEHFYMKELPKIKKGEVKRFSANGVPWPLDDYLELTGQLTTEDTAEIAKRWGK